MSVTAVLCSGQGSQNPAMFDVLATRPEAQPILAVARHALGGRDPYEFVKEAKGEEIHQNAVAQILCATHAIGWWAILQPIMQGSLVIAGYSVGEIPAWHVGGAVDPAKTLQIVAQRAALMDEATVAPAGLAAILGLPRGTLESLIRNTSIEIAIINGPLHFILGGPLGELRKLVADAQQLNAKRAVLLPVTVPSHTSILSEASNRFQPFLTEELAGVSLSPRARLISSVDAMWVRDVKSGGDKLAAQLSTTVDWAGCMDACRSARPSRIIELGPGDALTRMIADVAPDIPARSVSAFHSADGVLEWLATAC